MGLGVGIRSGVGSGVGSVLEEERVDQADDAVDTEVRHDLRLLEGLHDRRRVGEAGGLEHDHVELGELLLEPL